MHIMTVHNKCLSSEIRDVSQLKGFLFPYLPEGEFGNIMIKPNWVIHAERSDFPIEALVTNHSLIDAVVQCVLEKYTSAKLITIGDAPLQNCDWNLLLDQAGIRGLMAKYAHYRNPKIRFLDLRQDIFHLKSGFMIKDLQRGGDPSGYREVALDASSFLDPVSHMADRFRVSDYDPQETGSSHRRGFHRYLIAGSVLEAELVINMPKMKTHQRAGITGALKNLVGTNGQKAHLAHHRQGSPAQGGDEFAPDASFLIRAQIRSREILQKRSRILFLVGKTVWEGLRRARGIKTQVTAESLRQRGRFYIGSGSWYGNDTIWRMIYDMNKIILYAPPGGGGLCKTPQRDYVAVLDGTTAGEANGPLQPLPVQTKVVAMASDPFLMDMCMAQMMGFDWQKIALLKNYGQFDDENWARFDPVTVKVNFDGRQYSGISSLPVLHRFIPPPGWKGHIESQPRG